MNFKTHAPARREGVTLQPNIDIDGSSHQTGDSPHSRRLDYRQSTRSPAQRPRTRGRSILGLGVPNFQRKKNRHQVLLLLQVPRKLSENSEYFKSQKPKFFFINVWSANKKVHRFLSACRATYRTPAAAAAPAGRKTLRLRTRTHRLMRGIWTRSPCSSRYVPRPPHAGEQRAK
jgi:hypothetical protein